MATPSSTQYWQLTTLVVELFQFALYIEQLDDYVDGLEEVADNVLRRVEEKAPLYFQLRDFDTAYYSYYDALPDYNISQSNVQRVRAKPVADFARRFKRESGRTHGYGRMSLVNEVAIEGRREIPTIAIDRSRNLIDERARVNDHVLARWGAFVKTPLHLQGSASYGLDAQVRSGFKSVDLVGRGANSALTALGQTLERGRDG